MQVDSAHITMDAKENNFATFGQSIVGNITTYTSSDDEEEEGKNKWAKEKKKQKTYTKPEKTKHRILEMKRSHRFHNTSF